MSMHEDIGGDCAAYVLGALPVAEAEALREHMETCASCRAEVARLRAVSEALARGVPLRTAPSDLRRRVLAAVESESALLAAAAGTPRPAPARRRALLARPVAALAGAAALGLGLALGALVIAPDATSTRVIGANVAAPAAWHAGRAPSAVLRETGTNGELVLQGLPAAPAGRIYEVWVERGGRPLPTDALFNATAAGDATVAVPGGLRGAGAVLVTAERLGGARVPTMAPLVRASLG